MSSPQQAHAIVTTLAEGGGGPWPLDRAAVAERLHALVDTPVLLRQGRLNLCGPAAVLTIWFARDPVAAATYAVRLFLDGRATIGPLEVQASAGLLRHAYDPSAHGANTPAADWMMMSALRDSTNRMLRYRHSHGLREAAAAITMPGAVAGWLAATGLYRDLRDQTGLMWRKGLRHAYGLSPSAGTDVIALVAMEMFRRPDAALKRARDALVSLVPNHWVLLRTHVTRTDAGKVSFRFWSWGAEHIAVISPARLRRCYFGAIVAHTSETSLRSPGMHA